MVLEGFGCENDQSSSGLEIVNDLLTLESLSERCSKEIDQNKSGDVL